MSSPSLSAARIAGASGSDGTFRSQGAQWANRARRAPVLHPVARVESLQIDAVVDDEHPVRLDRIPPLDLGLPLPRDRQDERAGFWIRVPSALIVSVHVYLNMVDVDC